MLNKKSTSKKGKDFEIKVFNVFSRLLMNGDLSIDGKRSKIYHRKGYFSQYRKKDIIMDISIETFLEGADNYSYLTIIECKDYKKKVPVDDIEEFKSKLDQIAGKNVKGMIVTRNGFQEGTVEVANSLGIALIRLTDNQNVNWDVYRAKKGTNIDREQNTDIFKGLINVNQNSNHFYCFCYYNNKYFSSYYELLKEMEIDVLNDNILIDDNISINTIKIPYLQNEIIEDITYKLIENTLKYSKLVETPVPIEKLVNYITKKHHIRISENINLGLNHYGEKILARYNPMQKTVEIDKMLDEHRKRFTIAHEIGHIILHKSYLINPLAETDETVVSLTLDYKNRKRAEIQANIFATNLLMPRKLFLPYVYEIANKLRYKYRNNYLIFIDNQPINYNNFNILCRELSNIFNVSNQAVEFHLKYFNLVKDERNQIKRIKDVVDKIN